MLVVALRYLIGKHIQMAAIEEYTERQNIAIPSVDNLDELNLHTHFPILVYIIDL